MSIVVVDEGYKIVISNPLGKGAFGTVYDCLKPDQNESEKAELAAKVIIIKKFILLAHAK